MHKLSIVGEEGAGAYGVPWILEAQTLADHPASVRQDPCDFEDLPLALLPAAEEHDAVAGQAKALGPLQQALSGSLIELSVGALAGTAGLGPHHTELHQLSDSEKELVAHHRRQVATT